VKIFIGKIPPLGLEVKEKIDYVPDEIDVAGIASVESVEIDLKISRKDNLVNLNGKYRAFFKAECSRCCTEFDYQLDKPVKFEYKVDSQTEIDVKQIILEDILLSLPVKFLCRKDCQVLCKICGQNLNIDSCRHQNK
jgi:uncharacterized protein